MRQTAPIWTGHLRLQLTARHGHFPAGQNCVTYQQTLANGTQFLAQGTMPRQAHLILFKLLPMDNLGRRFIQVLPITDITLHLMFLETHRLGITWLYQ